MVHNILGDLGAGALYATLAALSFALWNIFLQRGLERGAAPRLALLTMSLAITASFLPLSVWLGYRRALPALHARGLGLFLLAGVLTAGLGPFLAAHATRRIGAARTTALRLLDPFFAFVIAWVFLGERVGARAAAGIALIAAALLLLGLDARQTAAADPGPERVRGIAFAVGASLFFTLGSIARKLGLGVVPSAVVAGAGEGVAGLLVLVPALLTRAAWAEVGALRRRPHPDLWISGFASAAGTLFLNMALQRVPVPVAVALRNTSPWFALLLVPLLIGREQRPGRWIWASTALLTAGMLLIVLR